MHFWPASATRTDTHTQSIIDDIDAVFTQYFDEACSAVCVCPEPCFCRRPSAPMNLRSPVSLIAPLFQNIMQVLCDAMFRQCVQVGEDWFPSLMCRSECEVRKAKWDECVASIPENRRVQFTQAVADRTLSIGKEYINKYMLSGGVCPSHMFVLASPILSSFPPSPHLDISVVEKEITCYPKRKRFPDFDRSSATYLFAKLLTSQLRTQSRRL